MVIVGPTASGKSALALELARARGGVVINADAMQTYDAFPILTAQPTEAERQATPHRLYGVLPLSETLSAQRWRELAGAEIGHAHDCGRLPILCGGSGLYLRALMAGFSPVPLVPAEVRTRGTALWDELGSAAFRAALSARDPATVARLALNDRQRHIRAWEVLEATGRPLSEWQAAPPVGAPPRLAFTTILVAPDRAEVRARIERRLDAMLGGGVLEEVRAVFDRQPDPTWPGLKAHGAPELIRHFQGELSLADARRIAIDHTRQYAKRQMTWARHQLTPDLVFEGLGGDAVGAVAQFLDKTRP